MKNGDMVLHLSADEIARIDRMRQSGDFIGELLNLVAAVNLSSPEEADALSAFLLTEWESVRDAATGHGVVLTESTSGKARSAEPLPNRFRIEPGRPNRPRPDRARVPGFGKMPVRLPSWFWPTRWPALAR